MSPRNILALAAVAAALSAAASAEQPKSKPAAAKPAAAKPAASKPAASKPAAAKPATQLGDPAMIASAMRAAPAAVAQHATIVAVGADGSMRQLRAGTNGFTCMPDNPATPGPDPMCGDANAMEWAMAWMKHEPPPAGKVGFMYMLEGGTDASNTDPYAKEPTANNHWISTGPHVMIVGPPPPAGYPTRPDPDTKQPYVMWAGTPYAHLMLPVR